MKIGIKKVVDVDVTTVEFFAKIRDEGVYTFKDSDGEEVKRIEDYVPSIFPGNDGDYIELDIDLETGLIKNWDPARVRRYLRQIINGDDE